MEKRYYEDPYEKTFTAKVLSCTQGKQGFEIILDKTCFYPEGGGQPGDTGFLGEVRVKDTKEREGQVVHLADRPLPPGSQTEGRIDWERRFSYMQQHTGEHIVSGLIHEAYGYENVGFHMGAEEMTIDISGVLSWQELMAIEAKANQILWDNVPVLASWPSEEELAALSYRSKKELKGQVRIVKVPGADCCACCGTHVARTGEIGLIKCLSLIHYKGGVRITLACGAQALKIVSRRVEQASAVSVLLSAKVEEIVEAVERQQEELSRLKGQNASLAGRFLACRAEAMAETKGIVAAFEENLTPVQVRQFANLLMEQGKGRICAVFSENGQGFFYALASAEGDMREFSKAVNRELSGRGGGSRPMAQGSVKASRQEIEAFLMRAEKDVTDGSE